MANAPKELFSQFQDYLNNEQELREVSKFFLDFEKFLFKSISILRLGFCFDFVFFFSNIWYLHTFFCTGNSFNCEGN